jgi:tellurite resistance protein
MPRPVNRERHASLCILAHVVRADGRVRCEELLALDALADRTGSISTVQILRDRTALDALLRAVVSPELRQRALVEAVAVAGVDGHCPREELAVLERIQRAFGASTWIDLAGQSAAWRHRTGMIRQAMEEATVAHLHRVQAAAASNDLSMDRYLRLVAELAHAKREIQRGLCDAVDAGVEALVSSAGRRDMP